MGEPRSRPTTGTDPQRRESDLVAPGLVHELRQSLTGLDAGLKLVERALGTAATELDGWRIATAQLARLRETLDTYQQLMSPDAADHDAFAVEPVVRRAVEAVRFRLDGARDRVAMVIERDVPQAWGSPRALLHALTNLLSNALDAVGDTGAAGRIEIRALRAGASAQVRVADEGTGISPEHRRQLFRTRFTTKPRGSGSGLGLAIARRMLRRSGGELRLVEPRDPARRPWARTEFVVDLAAGPDAPAPQELPPPRRRVLARAAVAVALAATLIAAVWLGWAALRRPSRASEAPQQMATAAAVAVGVEVLEVQGRVERLRRGAWEPVANRDRLELDDTLRADAGSRATLAIGEGSRLAVSDATQLTVREITAAVQRLRLSRGRISVDHQPDGARVLVVESEDGDAVARAGTARFSVLASGRSLAVATEAGAVRLRSAGRTVDVAAGQQSVAFRGSAPRAPAPIPLALLLRVARAARAAHGSCTIEGVAEPGAEVRVEGRVVEPGPQGAFAVRVRLEPGRRYATIVTRDAAGRSVQRRAGCAAEQDVSDFAVRWGRDAPPKAP
jgi:ferric-dicitrate binding protein FerR (iron transport regulator)